MSMCFRIRTSHTSATATDATSDLQRNLLDMYTDWCVPTTIRVLGGGYGLRALECMFTIDIGMFLAPLPPTYTTLLPVYLFFSIIPQPILTCA